MPIYEYECKKCKAHTEVFQKVSDKPLTKCRKCGGRLEKLLSAPAIQFKGSGWYVTDYAGKGKAASEKAEKADADAPAASDKSSEKKTEKHAKETSPSKKTSGKASSTKVSSGD